MKRYGLFLLACLAMCVALSGCDLAQDHETVVKPQKATTAKVATDTGGYYGSRSDLARHIYCANDPQYKKLLAVNLEHFDTLAQAQERLPGFTLHRSCQVK